MDHIDTRLLQALQRNAQLTAHELGEMLNLSASQAGRRRARLEELGVVTSYRAHLDPLKLGLTVQSFIQVQMASHNPKAGQEFASLMERLSDVVSVWTLTGEADYLLRVYSRDLPALNHLIHDVILAHPSVARVQSQIVMNQLKPDAPFPTG